MKNILPVLFLFFMLSMPSFADESVFIPDITAEQAKNAVVDYIVSRGWILRGETERSLDFYKTEMAHDDSKYQQDKYIYEKLKQINDSKEETKEFQDKHPALSALSDTMSQPSYWNSTKTISLQFYFLENNGVTIKTNTSTQEIKDMMRIVFAGYYSYNIEYKIPLLKKDYIKISDTNQTYYTLQTRMGSNRKIVKINDKNIREYEKSNLKYLLANCTQERIKLETDDNLGKQTFYILRTYTEPTYKQYLQ